MRKSLRTPGITEEFRVRHSVAVQQALGMQELGIIYWIPGLGNPADGLTKTKQDTAPLLRPSESGVYNPGTLRPLRGVAPNG